MKGCGATIVGLGLIVALGMLAFCALRDMDTTTPQEVAATANAKAEQFDATQLDPDNPSGGAVCVGMMGILLAGAMVGAFAMQKGNGGY